MTVMWNNKVDDFYSVSSHFKLAQQIVTLWNTYRIHIIPYFIWQTFLSYRRSAPFMHKELSGASVCVTHTFKVFCSGWFMTHLNSVDHGMRKIISLKALWKKKNPKKQNFTQTFNAYFHEFWWVTLVPSNAESTSLATHTGPKRSVCKSTRLFTWLCSFTHEKSWLQVTLNANVLHLTQARNMLSCFIWPSKILTFFQQFLLIIFYFSCFLLFLPHSWLS